MNRIMNSVSGNNSIGDNLNLPVPQRMLGLGVLPTSAGSNQLGNQFNIFQQQHQLQHHGGSNNYDQDDQPPRNNEL